mmetsp:Transcript_30957/g.72381  ORF Transcript_30957/g.72381 Transcript_30957/m.72381 type:complete len:184 (-) Transcript_30957:95-646(-)
MSDAIARRSAAAQEEGRRIYEHWAPKGTHECFVQIKPEDLDAVGGEEGFVEIFVVFYKLMLEDPRMNVLFDKRFEDVNVPAVEHGKRLAYWYLQRYGGLPVYGPLRPGNIFANLGKAHKRSQNCPMRPEKQQGKGFTVDQRDIWIGYQMMSCRECKVPQQVEEKLMMLHAGYGMAFIGPFIKA